jgi:alanine dehydrogenase
VIVEIGDGGGIGYCIRKTLSVRSRIYLCKGMLTNPFLAEEFGLPNKELDLLLAAD